MTAITQVRITQDGATVYLSVRDALVLRDFLNKQFPKKKSK